jgi:uncharacterized protein HemX
MNDDEQRDAIVINSKSLPMVLVALLAVSGGGLGSYSAWQAKQFASDPQARADPWTGTDARKQGAALRADIEAIRKKQEENCEKMERRVDTVETGLAVITSRLDRIIRILDAKYYEGERR